MTLKFSFYRPHDRVVFDGSVIDPKTGEVTYPPSKTKQSHLAECDINRIVRQFTVTGQFQHVNARAMAGAFMDLPDELDFQSALNTVIEGERAFNALPAMVRDRFDNDPASFLQFFNDPKNKDEAVKLGLVVPPLSSSTVPQASPGAVPEPASPAGPSSSDPSAKPLS